MKMIKRHGMTLLLLVLTMLPLAAQKQFTLEDLNFGGTNYQKMVPANRSLTWWGDQLLRLSKDTIWTVDTKGKEKLLLTRDRLNKDLGLKNESTQVGNLNYASFPFPDKPVMVLYNKSERLLVNFKTPKVEWRGERAVGAVAEEWNKNSCSTAFVKDDDLYVTSHSK